MNRILAAACVAPSLLACAPAVAQEKSAIRDGFVLPPGKARILLLRPAIRVGAQSTGGMAEPNADWTAQARDLIGAALSKAQGTLGNEVVSLPDPVGPAAATTADYQALFRAVADSVVEFKLFPGNRLPTKKRGGFDWTLGPGVAAIAGDSGADYVLFLFTEDRYGSTGRKVAQVLMAGLLGVGIPSGVHMGYAGLVDLKTGDLVWINADVAMGGDVRTPEGAEKRVRQLLEDFPGRPAPAPEGTAK